MGNNMRYSLKIKVNEVEQGRYEYVAQYDQFPSILGVGDTPEEALQEAQIFLDEYLDYCREEGITIIRADSNNWKENYNGKITLRMPKSLHRDLTNYADQDGMSINAIVNDAIRCYLSEQTMNLVKENVLDTITSYFVDMNTPYFDTPINGYRFKTKPVIS